MAESEIVVTGSPLNRDENELAISVDGATISGWETIEVTLRLEAFPNSFTVGMSSKSPAGGLAGLPQAGDPCAIMLGRDQVITGYVDRDVTAVGPAGHSIGLTGRGKTQDLVDCSAEWPSGQIHTGTVLDIAQKLALPYGIGVELADGADAGPQVPPWVLNYGETAAEIIQRFARNAGLLAYEDGSGKLILAAIGTKRAASGIAYGENVQLASVENSMDGRFSDVVVCNFGMESWDDFNGSDYYDTKSDPNVPRHRQLDLVMEMVAEGPQEFTVKKALWEVARRAGRGTVVHATVDSWRDSAGRLWLPNTIVPVNLPGLRVAGELCISEVTFSKNNETGTTATLMLMPPDAFRPEPVSLVPTDTAGIEVPT